MSADELIELEAKGTTEFDNYDDPGTPYMVLGRGWDGAQKNDVSDVLSVSPGHLLTVAATRSGKGTSHIIPNLLLYGGSCVVIDPMGENYNATYEYRRTYGRVVRIDPFRITQEFDPVSPFSAFNPMEFVSDESDARRLGTILLGDSPNGDGAFWYEEALNLLNAVILACASIERRRLSEVREVLTASYDENDGNRNKVNDGLRILEKATPNVGAKRRISAFLGYEVKMQSSILASINAKMGIWDTPEIEEAVSRTDLPFENLKTEISTIYVILPFDKMHDYAALFRLIIAQFRQAMMKTQPLKRRIPVACFIDEFASLGRMDEFTTTLAEIAGYPPSGLLENECFAARPFPRSVSRL